MADMNDQHLLLLGEIKGKVDALVDADKTRGEVLQSIDKRVRAVEQKAAVAGAVSGGVVSVGIGLITAVAREWLSGRGPGQS